MKIKSILLISLSLMMINKMYAANLQWSTYVGGAGDEEGRALASDAAGNVYITGWTTSTGISTNGSSFSGVYDAFISKFNTEGKLVWTTYYGGSDIENSFGIAIDKSGGIYICGSTASADGIATNGAYQTKPGGFTDGFLAKFDKNGTRIWSTYFGGPLDDQAVGIALDSSANIYITGFTLSTKDIATAGAYQTQNGGARNNGFLAKFDSSGSIEWSTYYGGNQNDYLLAIATDNIGNVYVAGNGSSHNGIATAGAFRSSVGSFYDGFLAKFTDSGTLLWGTYFGSDGDDECEGICVDLSGNVYVSGNTSSNNGVATAGAYQTSYSGGYDVFLAKFNSSGAIVWATYYGGSGNDFAWGMNIDKTQNISISGYSSSDNGITTPGAYQGNSAGMNDAYAAQFNPDGKLIWASYFGGPANDYAYAAKSDQEDNLYIAGVTSSKSGIASKGSYSNTLSGSTDAYLAKFNNPTSELEKAYENSADLGIFPNPVSDHATIVYSLIEATHVSLELFDINGKLLVTLKDEIQSAGIHNYIFDTNKSRWKEGVYIVRLSTNYGIFHTDFMKR